MKYAFVLGRHPALSVAELLRAVPGLEVESVIDGVCIGSADELTAGFLNLLGGTVKIAEVVTTLPTVAELNAEVLRTFLPPRTGRMIFGFSAYGHFTVPERRTLYIQGLELKKMLKEEGRRARYVVSRDTQLSSVVVAKNKLIEEGAEFIIMKSPKKVTLARTIAVQEFEAYGERDFDRPGRSARRGMLPPKLAQMMINIAHGDKNLPLLDPFCGSGTVLGEALLMGYAQVIGADLDGQAVTDSIAYLTWLEERHPEFRGRWKVSVADARRLDSFLPVASVGCIVAEPFLGPPQKGGEAPLLLKKMMDETLVPLYRDALTTLSKLLAPSGTAVVAFPVFGGGARAIRVPVADVSGALTVEPLVSPAYDSLKLPITPSGGAIYERPEQRVAREIVLLRNG